MDHRKIINLRLKKTEFESFVKQLNKGLVEIKVLETIVKKRTLIFIHSDKSVVTCDVTPSSVPGYFAVENVFLDGLPLIDTKA